MADDSKSNEGKPGELNRRDLMKLAATGVGGAMLPGQALSQETEGQERTLGPAPESPFSARPPTSTSGTSSALVFMRSTASSSFRWIASSPLSISDGFRCLVLSGFPIFARPPATAISLAVRSSPPKTTPCSIKRNPTESGPTVTRSPDRT